MQLKNSIESNSLPIVYAISYSIACFTLRQATLTSCLSVRPSVHSSAVDKFADSATTSSHVFSVCPLCRCLTVYCGGAAPVPHLVTGSQCYLVDRIVLRGFAFHCYWNDFASLPKQLGENEETKTQCCMRKDCSGKIWQQEVEKKKQTASTRGWASSLVALRWLRVTPTRIARIAVDPQLLSSEYKRFFHSLIYL